jgi:protein SERAC1
VTVAQILQALVLASQAVHTQVDDAHLIYNSVKGLIFLGTPHAGSTVDRQKRIRILKMIAKAAFTEVPPKLESALELHSDELADLADDFRKITLWTKRKLIIYTYFETRATAAIGDLVSSQYSVHILCRCQR